MANEARLIDANAVDYENIMCSQSQLHWLNAIIEQQPTIDPESLRPKGKWRLNKDGSGTCSECHRTRNDVWDMDNWNNFCSHCGAKMED
jgi:PHP family Zn ribbon phosphoesterase